MDKPKCRLCGERHYGLCVNGPAVAEAVARVVKIETMVPAAEPPIRRSGEKFDRATYQREYMREYMRRYRARKKAGDAK